MAKVSKKDIMSIPQGTTIVFELEDMRACLSARAYAYQLAKVEGFKVKTQIIGTRFCLTRV